MIRNSVIKIQILEYLESVFIRKVVKSVKKLFWTNQWRNLASLGMGNSLKSLRELNQTKKSMVSTLENLSASKLDCKTFLVAKYCKTIFWSFKIITSNWLFWTQHQLQWFAMSNMQTLCHLLNMSSFKPYFLEQKFPKIV